MATLAQLAAKGTIEAIEVDLDGSSQPLRRFYGSPNFVKWLHEQLPDLHGDSYGRLSPREQIYELLARFIEGGRLVYEHDLHELKPLEDDVWELRTADIRIFGWFAEKDAFIAVAADEKKKIVDHKLYAGHRDEVVTYRERLDLNEPKYRRGAGIDDVLSVAN